MEQAGVIPLYKGRGKRDCAGSHRPISLCQCLGKLLEKIAHLQLSNCLHINKLLYPSQHGFVSQRSSVTNLLVFDSFITNAASVRHPFDIVSFDFKKAFDKTHEYVIQAASNIGINGKALDWLTNFLHERTQKVRIGDIHLRVNDVTSGIIQGSSLGPDLYTIFIDSLLRRIQLPAVAFADDLKFIADVIHHTAASVQEDVNIVADWANENHTPLSVEKCGILHCGSHQPLNAYYLYNIPMTVMDSFVDLGVERSSTVNNSLHYQNLIARACRAAGFIRRTFRIHSKKLLWSAFQYYVLSILIYASQLWSPTKLKDIRLIEAVQRRFTKCIYELRGLSYEERLRELHVLTLAKKRTYMAIIFVYKYLLSLHGCSLADVGLSLVKSVTRGNGVRLVQHKEGALFSQRAPRTWNAFPARVVTATNISSLKHKFFNYLFDSQ